MEDVSYKRGKEGDCAPDFSPRSLLSSVSRSKCTASAASVSSIILILTGQSGQQ